MSEVPRVGIRTHTLTGFEIRPCLPLGYRGRQSTAG